jgi:hypothetical protein
VLLDHRQRSREQAACGVEDRLRLRRRARHGERAGRPCEVVEAQAQDDGAADPSPGAQASRDPVDDPDDRRVDLGEGLRSPAERTL